MVLGLSHTVHRHLVASWSNITASSYLLQCSNETSASWRLLPVDFEMWEAVRAAAD